MATYNLPAIQIEFQLFLSSFLKSQYKKNIFFFLYLLLSTHSELSFLPCMYVVEMTSELYEFV